MVVFNINYAFVKMKVDAITAYINGDFAAHIQQYENLQYTLPKSKGDVKDALMENIIKEAATLKKISALYLELTAGIEQTARDFQATDQSISKGMRING